jgi:hypothetical protein
MHIGDELSNLDNNRNFGNFYYALQLHAIKIRMQKLQ